MDVNDAGFKYFKNCPCKFFMRKEMQPFVRAKDKMRDVKRLSICIRCNTVHGGTKLCFSWSPVQNKKNE